MKIQNLDASGAAEEGHRDGYGGMFSSFYPVHEGVNRITPRNDGLIYIFYTPQYEQAPKVRNSLCHRPREWLLR